MNMKNIMNFTRKILIIFIKKYSKEITLKFRERRESRLSLYYITERKRTLIRHGTFILLNSKSHWLAVYNRNCYSCGAHTSCIIAAGSWMRQTIRGWASREEKRGARFGLFEGQRSVIHMYTCEDAKQWADNRDAHMFDRLQLCVAESILFDSTKRCV